MVCLRCFCTHDVSTFCVITGYRAGFQDLLSRCARPSGNAPLIPPAYLERRLVSVQLHPIQNPYTLWWMGPNKGHVFVPLLFSNILYLCEICFRFWVLCLELCVKTQLLRGMLICIVQVTQGSIYMLNSFLTASLWCCTLTTIWSIFLSFSTLKAVFFFFKLWVGDSELKPKIFYLFFVFRHIWDLHKISWLCQCIY